MYHIYSNARQGFPLNLGLKYVKLSSFRIWNTKSDHSEPDHVEPNQGLHHHIVMWTLYSSGYYAA